MMLGNLLSIILSYGVGTISFSFFIGVIWKGIDLRDYGSGNLGTTNAFRVLGTIPGILVFIGDALKGVVAVIFSRTIGDGGPVIVLLCGLAAIVGHCLPFYLNFKGGKGVATGAGVIVSIVPNVTLAAAIIWIAVLVLTRYVSLASIIAAASVPILMIIFSVPSIYLILGVLAPVFVIYRHRSNIARILAGTETKIGKGKRLW